MHGNADSVVPISYAERAAEVYPDVEYFVIDGAGHGFSGRALDESIRYIFNYLQEAGLLQNKTQNGQTLRVTIGDTVGYAELNDNATARAFLELLQPTVTMNDLHRREYWFSHALPYDSADVVHDYAPGQLTYWCGGWVTAYYDRDDDSVIEDGLVVIGTMDSTLVDAFLALNGASVSVQMELAA